MFDTPKCAARAAHRRTFRLVAAALTLIAAATVGGAAAQDSSAVRAAAPADTVPAHPDTAVKRRKSHADTTHLAAVTITAAPPAPSEPNMSITITQSQIARRRPIRPTSCCARRRDSRRTSRGRGPASPPTSRCADSAPTTRPTSRSGSTACPINEPVNGHAEGYNDFNLIFPQAVTGIDVLKGPVSALYGNFAFSGIINVRTVEHMDGTQAELTAGSIRQLRGLDAQGLRARRHERRARLARLARRWMAAPLRRKPRAAPRTAVQQLSDITTLDCWRRALRHDYKSPGFLDTASYERGRLHVVSNFGDGGYKRHAQERASLAVQFTSDALLAHDVVRDAGHLELLVEHAARARRACSKGSGVETREYDGRYGGGATTALTYTRARRSESFWASTSRSAPRCSTTHSHYENWARQSTAFARTRQPTPRSKASQVIGRSLPAGELQRHNKLRLMLRRPARSAVHHVAAARSAGSETCCGWNNAS